MTEPVNRPVHPSGAFDADARSTFIAALHRLGSIAAASRETGFNRSTPAYWRARDPLFAAAMAGALGAPPESWEPRHIAREEGAKPGLVPRPYTKTTPEKLEIFLDCLGVTSNVAASARAAGVDDTTLYRLRRKDAGFARQWLEALSEGHEHLAMEVLARARFGVEKPVFHSGKRVGEFREYSDGVALKLLSLHKQEVAQFRAAQLGVDEDLLLEEIDAKLADMKNCIEDEPC
jgi:transposase-like protein